MELHAAEPASTVVVGGGETFTLVGTVIIFKSLGMKTTIKQLKPRMAGAFEDADGNGSVRGSTRLRPNKSAENTTGNCRRRRGSL